MGKWIFCALFSVLAIGCSKPVSSESLISGAQSLAEGCNANYVKSRYIVRYHDGRTAVFEYADREKFKTEVVEPDVSNIAYIEYDQTFKVDFKPKSDVQFSASMIDNWGLARIGAERAWQLGVRGEGVTVGVIDSGLDINHTLLQNQIAYNEGEIGLDSKGKDKRFNGKDDDGNGYVDDWTGYDFVNRTGQMSDDLTHGTHVSGIIVAEHNENFVRNDTVQGLAPKAKVVPIKFLSKEAGSLGGALASLDYARKRKVQIINASWGGPTCSKALRDKIKDVTGDGIIFVAAAGNEGANLDFAPEFPAAFQGPLQLTVGSTSMMDGMSSFSNYSRTFVNLFAPGFSIYSTLPNNQVGPESGTSMATPFVSAALALLWSVNPSIQPEEIIQTLLSSVVKNASYANSSEGRLDVSAAVEKMRATHRP